METKSQQIRALLIANPRMKTSAIVRKLKCGVSTVYAVKAEIAVEDKRAAKYAKMMDVSITSSQVTKETVKTLAKACEAVYTFTKNNRRLCITFDGRVDGVEVMIDEELYRVPMPEFENVIESIKHIQMYHQDFNNEVKGE